MKSMGQFKPQTAPFEGSQRHRAVRKRYRDVEKAVQEPLLKKSDVSKIPPPNVPAPDF